VETFVVRVWTPEAEPVDAARVGPLHGTVEHVSTGSATAFFVEDELVDFLRAQAQGGDRAEGACA
jgi:hypothetical protein